MTTPVDRARIPEAVLSVCRTLRDRGHGAWLVGGCLRDLLLGRDIADWDVATSALPAEVQSIFARTVPTGLLHGTVTVLQGPLALEVTTLRGEVGYSDGRHPDRVVFVRTIEEDLKRRDFTVNAIAYDPHEDRIIDPWQGRRDLAKRRLAAVGDPLERFREDGLRPLRGARFAATLEFDIEPATLVAISGALDVLARVSAERIRDEIMKSLAARAPSRALRVIASTGMLAQVLPEMVPSVGCAQNRFHAYDVWEHSLHAVDACESDAPVRLATLLHDVGKPASRATDPRTGDFTFYDHDKIGAPIADAALRRLRVSNDERERVVHLVRHHLFLYADEWSDAAVRRFLRRVGTERLEDLFALHRADVGARGTPGDDLERLARLEVRIREVVEAGHALCVRELAIGGRDVMEALAITPGPRIGEILRELLERVTEDPALNERDRLLELTRRIGSEPRGVH